MKKVFMIIMIISITLGIMCPILYNIIGSEVLEDGTLSEPFYLVGFMWIFVFISIASLVAFLISKKKEKANKIHN